MGVERRVIKPAGGAIPVPAISLTDAPTVAINAAAGSRHKVTITANRTLGNPTGAYDGQILTIAVTQDATGGRTVALAGKFRLAAGQTLTWSTVAGRTDRLAVQYDLAADRFDVVGFAPGFGD